MTTEAPTALTLEVVDPKLALVVKEQSLDLDSAATVLTTFEPLIQLARKWQAKVDSIKVTDASQKSEMALARSVRLGLREVRLDAEKARKRLKESALKQGRVVDGAANIIKGITEPLEAQLQEAEDFVERQEIARKARLKAEREALLAPFAIDTSVYVLADMSDPQFNQLLAGTKLAHEAKAQAALEAEKARLAKEAEEAKQREAVRVENERLKAEAVKREAEVAVERAEAARKQAHTDAVAKKEREALAATAAAEKRVADAALATERKKTADAAAEVKRIRDAEDARVAKEKADKEAEAARVAAAAKAAARAPEKDKLLAFAALIEGLTLPTLTTPEGKTVLVTLKEQNAKYAAWVRKQGEAL